MAARDNGLVKTRSNQMIKNNSFMFSKVFSRRKFLKNLACAGAAFAFAPLLVNGVLAAESKAPQKNWWYIIAKQAIQGMWPMPFINWWAEI